VDVATERDLGIMLVSLPLLMLTLMGVAMAQTTPAKTTKVHKPVRAASSKSVLPAPQEVSAERQFAQKEYDALNAAIDAMKEELDRTMARFEKEKSKPTENLMLEEYLLDRADLLDRKRNSGVEELEVLGLRLKHVDDCTSVYHNTIDLKVSDLTGRQTESVKACRSLGLYPPEK
jgi:hypothetical protein